jgi:hypothetical protein
VARSGTTLFVSLEQEALGAEERRDLKAALAIAAEPQPLAGPLDWQHTVYPSRWRSMGCGRVYDWVGPDGAGGVKGEAGWWRGISFSAALISSFSLL